MRIETARLVIRTFEPRDEEAWLAMVTDPDFRRYLPPGPAPTAETFQNAIQGRHAMERERGFAMWAVDVRETGLFVGQCGVRPVETISGGAAGSEIDLAYHFNKAAWNKGYGTEAVIAVLAYVFGSIGLSSVMAVVMPENIGSCRVAEKAGMRFEGIANYYGLTGLKKYVADRDWWKAPT
ncbi:MAG: GNAT family N-acetyltransferase [Candidatus Eremiobacteraeota bacterium]|nr:GNAT family N-acetyltransferase [Candidatus Eremiobacteraeota bacterium]